MLTRAALAVTPCARVIALAGGRVLAMHGEADSGAAVYDVTMGKQRRVPLCK